MGRLLSAVIIVLGFWIFLFPFVGPVVGLYLSPPPMGGAMHMSGGGSMANMPVVALNTAMVFSNFLPGVALMLIGIYHLFDSKPAHRAQFA